MSDKAMRNFVLCYLLGEWCAGVVLDRRARNQRRREAAIRQAGLLQGKQIGWEGGYAAGFSAGLHWIERAAGQTGHVLIYVGRKGNGKSLLYR